MSKIAHTDKTGQTVFTRMRVDLAERHRTVYRLDYQIGSVVMLPVQLYKTASAVKIYSAVTYRYSMEKSAADERGNHC